eukprot:Sspe_Gene.29208::Locus_13747_Transcript_1_1_Confidence_1.000_Length_9558::g.29208::m.29208
MWLTFVRPLLLAAILLLGADVHGTATVTLTLTISPTHTNTRTGSRTWTLRSTTATLTASPSPTSTRTLSQSLTSTPMTPTPTLPTPTHTESHTLSATLSYTSTHTSTPTTSPSLSLTKATPTGTTTLVLPASYEVALEGSADVVGDHFRVAVQVVVPGDLPPTSPRLFDTTEGSGGLRLVRASSHCTSPAVAVHGARQETFRLARDINGSTAVPPPMNVAMAWGTLVAPWEASVVCYRLCGECPWVRTNLSVNATAPTLHWKRALSVTPGVFTALELDSDGIADAVKLVPYGELCVRDEASYAPYLGSLHGNTPPGSQSYSVGTNATHWLQLPWAAHSRFAVCARIRTGRVSLGSEGYGVWHQWRFVFTHGRGGLLTGAGSPFRWDWDGRTVRGSSGWLTVSSSTPMDPASLVAHLSGDCLTPPAPLIRFAAWNTNSSTSLRTWVRLPLAYGSYLVCLRNTGDATWYVPYNGPLVVVDTVNVTYSFQETRAGTWGPITIRVSSRSGVYAPSVAISPAQSCPPASPAVLLQGTNDTLTLTGMIEIPRSTTRHFVCFRPTPHSSWTLALSDTTLVPDFTPLPAPTVSLSWPDRRAATWTGVTVSEWVAGDSLRIVAEGTRCHEAGTDVVLSKGGQGWFLSAEGKWRVCLARPQHNYVDLGVVATTPPVPLTSEVSSVYHDTTSLHHEGVMHTVTITAQARVLNSKANQDELKLVRASLPCHSPGAVGVRDLVGESSAALSAMAKVELPAAEHYVVCYRMAGRVNWHLVPPILRVHPANLFARNTTPAVHLGVLRTTMTRVGLSLPNTSPASEGGDTIFLTHHAAPCDGSERVAVDSDLGPLNWVGQSEVEASFVLRGAKVGTAYRLCWKEGSTGVVWGLPALRLVVSPQQVLSSTIPGEYRIGSGVIVGVEAVVQVVGLGLSVGDQMKVVEGECDDESVYHGVTVKVVSGTASVEITMPSMEGEYRGCYFHTAMQTWVGIPGPLDRFTVVDHLMVFDVNTAPQVVVVSHRGNATFRTEKVKVIRTGERCSDPKYPATPGATVRQPFPSSGVYTVCHFYRGAAWVRARHRKTWLLYVEHQLSVLDTMLTITSLSANTSVLPSGAILRGRAEHSHKGHRIPSSKALLVWYGDLPHHPGYPNGLLGSIASQHHPAVRSCLTPHDYGWPAAGTVQFMQEGVLHFEVMVLRGCTTCKLTVALLDHPDVPVEGVYVTRGVTEQVSDIRTLPPGKGTPVPLGTPFPFVVYAVTEHETLAAAAAGDLSLTFSGSTSLSLEWVPVEVRVSVYSPLTRSTAPAHQPLPSEAVVPWNVGGRADLRLTVESSNLVVLRVHISFGTLSRTVQLSMGSPEGDQLRIEADTIGGVPLTTYPTPWTTTAEFPPGTPMEEDRLYNVPLVLTREGSAVKYGTEAGAQVVPSVSCPDVSFRTPSTVWLREGRAVFPLLLRRATPLPSPTVLTTPCTFEFRAAGKVVRLVAAVRPVPRPIRIVLPEGPMELGRVMDMVVEGDPWVDGRLRVVAYETAHSEESPAGISSAMEVVSGGTVSRGRGVLSVRFLRPCTACVVSVAHQDGEAVVAGVVVKEGSLRLHVGLTAAVVQIGRPFNVTIHVVTQQGVSTSHDSVSWVRASSLDLGIDRSVRLRQSIGVLEVLPNATCTRCPLTITASGGSWTQGAPPATVWFTVDRVQHVASLAVQGVSNSIPISASSNWYLLNPLETSFVTIRALDPFGAVAVTAEARANITLLSSVGGWRAGNGTEFSTVPPGALDIPLVSGAGYFGVRFGSACLQCIVRVATPAAVVDLVATVVPVGVQVELLTPFPPPVAPLRTTAPLEFAVVDEKGAVDYTISYSLTITFIVLKGSPEGITCVGPCFPSGNNSFVATPPATSATEETKGMRGGRVVVRFTSALPGVEVRLVVSTTTRNTLGKAISSWTGNATLAWLDANPFAHFVVRDGTPLDGGHGRHLVLTAPGHAMMGPLPPAFDLRTVKVGVGLPFPITFQEVDAVGAPVPFLRGPVRVTASLNHRGCGSGTPLAIFGEQRELPVGLVNGNATVLLEYGSACLSCAFRVEYLGVGKAPWDERVQHVGPFDVRQRSMDSTVVEGWEGLPDVWKVGTPHSISVVRAYVSGGLVLAKGGTPERFTARGLNVTGDGRGVFPPKSCWHCRVVIETPFDTYTLRHRGGDLFVFTGTASRLRIDGPSALVARQPAAIRVTAVDESGNTDFFFNRTLVVSTGYRSGGGLFAVDFRHSPASLSAWSRGVSEHVIAFSRACYTGCAVSVSADGVEGVRDFVVTSKATHLASNLSATPSVLLLGHRVRWAVLAVDDWGDVDPSVTLTNPSVLTLPTVYGTGKVLVESFNMTDGVGLADVVFDGTGYPVAPVLQLRTATGYLTTRSPPRLAVRGVTGKLATAVAPPAMVAKGEAFLVQLVAMSGSSPIAATAGPVAVSGATWVGGELGFTGYGNITLKVLEGGTVTIFSSTHSFLAPVSFDVQVMLPDPTMVRVAHVGAVAAAFPFVITMRVTDLHDKTNVWVSGGTLAVTLGGVTKTVTVVDGLVHVELTVPNTCEECLLHVAGVSGDYVHDVQGGNQTVAVLRLARFHLVLPPSESHNAAMDHAARSMAGVVVLHTNTEYKVGVQAEADGGQIVGVIGGVCLRIGGEATSLCGALQDGRASIAVRFNSSRGPLSIQAEHAAGVGANPSTYWIEVIDPVDRVKVVGVVPERWVVHVPLVLRVQAVSATGKTNLITGPLVTLVVRNSSVARWGDGNDLTRPLEGGVASFSITARAEGSVVLAVSPPPSLHPFGQATDLLRTTFQLPVRIAVSWDGAVLQNRPVTLHVKLVDTSGDVVSGDNFTVITVSFLAQGGIPDALDVLPGEGRVGISGVRAAQGAGVFELLFRVASRGVLRFAAGIGPHLLQHDEGPFNVTVPPGDTPAPLPRWTSRPLRMVLGTWDTPDAFNSSAFRAVVGLAAGLPSSRVVVLRVCLVGDTGLCRSFGDQRGHFLTAGLSVDFTLTVEVEDAPVGVPGDRVLQTAVAALQDKVAAAASSCVSESGCVGDIATLLEPLQGLSFPEQQRTPTATLPYPPEDESTSAPAVPQPSPTPATLPPTSAPTGRPTLAPAPPSEQEGADPSARLLAPLLAVALSLWLLG